jgi:hypothetical protein
MKSMFAYICLGTNDLKRSAKFYDATPGQPASRSK